jgi:hypothetical protein
MIGLFAAHEGNYANRPIAHLRPLGKGSNLIDDDVCLGRVDLLPSATSPVWDVNINQRWIEAFVRFGNAERQHLLRIELHGKPDDRFHTAKMLPKHQALVRKHRPHQIINALAWFQETLERHVAKIMVPKLTDFLLRDEWCCRAYLPVIAYNKNFLTPQQRRQFRYIRL